MHFKHASWKKDAFLTVVLVLLSCVLFFLPTGYEERVNTEPLVAKVESLRWKTVRFKDWVL